MSVPAKFAKDRFNFLKFEAGFGIITVLKDLAKQSMSII